MTQRTDFGDLMSRFSAKDLSDGTRHIPTEDDFARIQEERGFPVPDDMRTFLTDWSDHATLGSPIFKIPGFVADDKGFLSFVDRFEPDGTFRPIKVFGKRIPKVLLPFARDPGGNVLCLGIGPDVVGRVFFWNHDHAQLAPGQLAEIKKKLRKYGAPIQRLDVHEMIIRWERVSKGEFDHQPGFWNVYEVAPTLLAFFESLQANPEYQ
jgi:hypothetical protein